jgi:hypothetical protein
MVVWPQVVFSRQSRRISERSCGAIGGRPGWRLDFRRHHQRQAVRCQRSRVAGLTTKTAFWTVDHRTAREEKKRRCHGLKRGRRVVRRRMTNCWRSSRFSAASRARGERKSTSAMTRWRRRLSTVSTMLGAATERNHVGPPASRTELLRPTGRAQIASDEAIGHNSIKPGSGERWKLEPAPRGAENPSSDGHGLRRRTRGRANR